MVFIHICFVSNDIYFCSHFYLQTEHLEPLEHGDIIVALAPLLERAHPTEDTCKLFSKVSLILLTFLIVSNCNYIKPLMGFSSSVPRSVSYLIRGTVMGLVFAFSWKTQLFHFISFSKEQLGDAYISRDTLVNPHLKMRKYAIGMDLFSWTI